MNFIVSNPVFDGSKLTFTVYSAFEYALKIKNLEMVTLPNKNNPVNYFCERQEPTVLSILV